MVKHRSRKLGDAGSIPADGEIFSDVFVYVIIIPPPLLIIPLRIPPQINFLLEQGKDHFGLMSLLESIKCNEGSSVEKLILSLERFFIP